MSKSSLMLQGEQEVSDVFAALTTLVADIKAGKGIGQDITDVLTGAVKIAGEAQALAGDVQADPVGSLNSAYAGALGIYGVLKG